MGLFSVRSQPSRRQNPHWTFLRSGYCIRDTAEVEEVGKEVAFLAVKDLLCMGNFYWMDNLAPTPEWGSKKVVEGKYRCKP